MAGAGLWWSDPALRGNDRAAHRCIERLLGEAGIRLEHIDLGGGLAISLFRVLLILISYALLLSAAALAGVLLAVSR